MVWIPINQYVMYKKKVLPVNTEMSWKSDPNLVDTVEQWTVLMFAAGEGQLEVVQVLLKNGADPSLKDVDGDTALVFAQRNSHVEVTRLLESGLR